MGVGGEGALAGADQVGNQHELELVDQTGGDGLAGELRAANADVRG